MVDAGGTEAGVVPVGSGSTASMKLISRNVPAFASSNSGYSDPKNANDSNVVAYKAAMQKNSFPADGDITTAAAGWTLGEITVEVLKEAVQSPDGIPEGRFLQL